MARGSAFANEAPAFTGGGTQNYSSTRTGWAAGAGIERMIAPHWTIGVEGLFADFGNFTKTSGADVGAKCCVAVHDKVFLCRAKLNYKF
jgi:opacity protein-like surface antigen